MTQKELELLERLPLHVAVTRDEFTEDEIELLKVMKSYGYVWMDLALNVKIEPAGIQARLEAREQSNREAEKRAQQNCQQKYQQSKMEKDDRKRNIVSLLITIVGGVAAYIIYHWLSEILHW